MKKLKTAREKASTYIYRNGSIVCKSLAGLKRKGLTGEFGSVLVAVNKGAAWFPVFYPPPTVHVCVYARARARVCVCVHERDLLSVLSPVKQ